MVDSCEIPLSNPASDEIKRILQETKTIAVVGISPNPDRPSFRVAQYLDQQGYKIIPVNPGHKEILGKKSYPSILDIPEQIDVVDIFRRPDAVGEIVKQAIQKKVRVVWMQEGVVNNEAAKKACDAGIKVVMDRCMLKEHRKLGTEPYF